MTVDIARADHNAIATLNGAGDALARLGQWVEAARNAHQLVAPLVETPFVPDAYRPKVDPRATTEQKQAALQVAIASATAAVLQGITLGLDPMTALQQIYVVHGRPGMYTEIKVALVKARGHEVWTEDLTDTRAVVCGRRAGTDYVERVTITMDMARKAGWTSNQAYAKTPQDMLYARAAGRVCDRIAPDVLMGISSVEEIQDTIQTTATAGTRTVRPPRKALPEIAAAVEDPPLDDDEQADTASEQVSPSEPVENQEDPPAEAGPAEPSISPMQSKKLHATLRDIGLGDRDAGLARIAELVGRPVTSTKELTRAEAAAVIDALEPTPDTDEPALDIEP